MKLIIDIPRSEYMKIKRYYDGLPEYSTVEAETYYIAHGIPLDDVKAEMEEMRIKFMEQGGVYEHSAYGLDYAIVLLDNISKAESEE